MLGEAQEVAKTGSQQSIKKIKLVVEVSKHGSELSTHYAETEQHLRMLEIGYNFYFQ